MDFSWTKIVHPSPLLVTTKMILEGNPVTLKCKAIGFPKPLISWVSKCEKKLLFHVFETVQN